jgi:hypothetical protein
MRSSPPKIELVAEEDDLIIDGDRIEIEITPADPNQIALT